MTRLALTVLLLTGGTALGLAAEPQVIEVKLESYAIKPDTITVKAGQPVTLKVKNEATFIPHNLVIKAPEAGIDVKINLSAGKSGEASFTPTKPGSYAMSCDKTPPFGASHKKKGMHGTLVVVE
jgi:plastocyanin